MRRAIAMALSLTLSGCATHHAHVARRPDPLHDWASVVAIPRPADVQVTLDGRIGGPLVDVTESTLTLRVVPYMQPRTISRAEITRVAVWGPKKIRWSWLADPLFIGAVGGLVGALVGAVMRNAKVAGTSLWVLAASVTGGYLYVVSDLYNDKTWRVVYVRP